MSNKYEREIKPGVHADVYDVIEAFKVKCPAIQHALKKLLATGNRGHKDYMTDLNESIDSIKRGIQLEEGRQSETITLDSFVNKIKLTDLENFISDEFGYIIDVGDSGSGLMVFKLFDKKGEEVTQFPYHKASNYTIRELCGELGILPRAVASPGVYCNRGAVQ